MHRTLCLLCLLVLVAPACEGEDPGAVNVRGPRARKPAKASPLLEPDCAEMNQTAPDVFKTSLSTSQGTVVIEVTRAWAPRGADRFYSLVKNGFFDNHRIYRVVPEWVAQWGVHGSPRVSAAWATASIQDDPVVHSNEKGTVCFAAGSQKHTRATQVFINLKDNSGALDPQGFAPFGKVIEGMDVVDKFYAGYGDGPPSGSGPDQARLQQKGNAYLQQSFPMLDYIVKATILEDG